MVYLMAKINHLIPLVAITANIKETWKELRRLIFKWVIKHDTTPRESLELAGLSYFNIIINPLLKLLERNVAIGIEDTKVKFYRQAIFNAFSVWKDVEPNLHESIIRGINMVVQKPLEVELNVKIWRDKVRQEAAFRLFKNTGLEMDINRAIEIKELKLIRLASNAPMHIIQMHVENYRLRKCTEEELISKLNNILQEYLIIKEVMENNIASISVIYQYNTPENIVNSENILEIRILYTINELIQKTKSELNRLLKGLVNINKGNNVTIIPLEITELINKTRVLVVNATKDEKNFLERVLEIMETRRTNTRDMQEKRKPGRPRKQTETKPSNQQLISNYFN